MKIVIVGGGTAGWITAAFFMKHTLGHDVTVIESSKIGIIGAGEGSTGALPWFIKQGSRIQDSFKWPDNLVNELDFLKKTKATLKMGIHMKNWKGDGTDYYSPFSGSPTDAHPLDTAFLGSILKNGRSDLSSMHSLIMEDKLSTFTKRNGRIEPLLDNHSYHFDAHEVGKYFKDICLKKGIKLIDTEVTNLQFDETEYLQKATLSNGQTIEADLWFDCSGFARVLMGKTSNKWVSYQDYLPTNTAVPFQTPNNSKTVRFETTAQAMDAGWMWRIPLQNRYGNGYVYCDQFTTYEKAIEEAEKVVMQKIEPINKIQFKAGRYENVWHKNIVAIGLSSHFLEPLEATSIHISIISASTLLFHFLKTKDCIKFEADKKRYNELTNIMIDDYMSFIQMHYLTGRNDTPFWKFITNELTITDKNKELIEISKYRLLNQFDVSNKNGTPGWPLWCHIMSAAGLFKPEMVERELKMHNAYGEAQNEMVKLMQHYNRLKKDLVSTEDFFKYLKV